MLSKIEMFMDNFSIKRKLLVMYVLCMFIPLILTDSVILGIVYHNVEVTQKHEMENVVNSVKYNFGSAVDSASKLAKAIYTSKSIDDFLHEAYPTNLDYVSAYQNFFSGTQLMASAALNNQKVKIYVDNDSIVAGSEFQDINEHQNTGWYKYICNSNLEKGICFDYVDKNAVVTGSKRKIYYFQKLNRYDQNSQNILLIELEYGPLCRTMESMNYNSTVYICKDDIIILSNNKNSSNVKQFERLESGSDIGYQEDYDIGGKALKIYVTEPKYSSWSRVLDYMPLILVLIAFNIILPYLMVSLINNSFSTRIRELSEAFRGVENEKLKSISNPRGQDEIGGLMTNYNKMAQRINDLIEIVYKNKIKEQEMIVARQNAELLALHSQINPHFLFNALESIRMHSLIKQENETALMVENLAVMQRQYVEWQEDSIQIRKEMELVEAYLTLQKYRFGERLSFEIDVDEECYDYYIPKLSVVTFVENACVHGIESKITQGWIFVRIYREDNLLCLEIEDTGNGIAEEEVELLLTKMKNANIEMLKEKGRVGIVNACLRLKMISQNMVEFEVDSEPGIGTMVQIKLPTEYVEKRNV